MRNAITFPWVVVVSFLIYAYATNMSLSAPDDVCETGTGKVTELVSMRNERESDFKKPSVYKNSREDIEIPLGKNRYTAWDNWVSFGPWDVGGGEEWGQICYWPTRMYFIERIAPRGREEIVREAFSKDRTTGDMREVLEYPGEQVVWVHKRENDIDTYTLEYPWEKYNYIWSAHHGRDAKENIDIWREMVKNSKLP